MFLIIFFFFPSYNNPCSYQAEDFVCSAICTLRYNYYVHSLFRGGTDIPGAGSGCGGVGTSGSPTLTCGSRVRTALSPTMAKCHNRRLSQQQSQQPKSLWTSAWRKQGKEEWLPREQDGILGRNCSLRGWGGPGTWCPEQL